MHYWFAARSGGETIFGEGINHFQTCQAILITFNYNCYVMLLVTEESTLL